MDFSSSDYDKRTEEVVKVEESRIDGRKSQLQALCKSMTVEEHLQLLKTILKGHVGAKYISVTYNVPIYNKHGVADTVIEHLREAGWFVDGFVNGYQKTLIIYNFRNYPQHQADYDEYPYRKFKTNQQGMAINIEFWTDVEDTDTSTYQRLMLFKDLIRVRLWGLLIDHDRICTNKS